jgi:uncharacterized membrane protein YbhN (UPF0104 family)
MSSTTVAARRRRRGVALPVAPVQRAEGAAPECGMSRTRRAWGMARRFIPPLVGIGLLIVSLTVLARMLEHFELAELVHELKAIGRGPLLWSLALTALSFTALVGYEHWALRFARKRLPLRHTALGAFIAQSIAHTTGFAAVVATSLRYRVYAPLGLDLLDVAKVQAFFVFTLGLALACLSGLVLLLEPQLPAGLVPLPLWAWRLVGLAALVAVLSYLLWTGVTHRRLRILGQVIRPPGPRVAFIQIILGFIDLGAAAAALWVLLPESLGVGYLELLGMFLVAVVLGVVSHVPGALGVLEGALLIQLAPGPEQTAAVLGALLAYRAVFYLLPFLLGSALYGLHEADRLGRFLRGGRAEAPPVAGIPRLDRVVPAAAVGLAVVVIAVLLLD